MSDVFDMFACERHVEQHEEEQARLRAEYETLVALRKQKEHDD